MSAEKNRTVQFWQVFHCLGMNCGLVDNFAGIIYHVNKESCNILGT